MFKKFPNLPTHSHNKHAAVKNSYSKRTCHGIAQQSLSVFYHFQYSCIPTARNAQKAFYELDQDRVYIKSTRL